MGSLVQTFRISRKVRNEASVIPYGPKETPHLFDRVGSFEILDGPCSRLGH